MTSTRLARGQRVGNRYRLERELGYGTDGTAWEAVDERLDRPVALRIFEATLDRKTIVRRAGLAASLTHPRVVRVFDTGQDGGRFFTVSELVTDSLQTVRLPLAPDAALQTAIDVVEALAYAHERGVVHGHLHEGNVMLSEGGAKVADFALAGGDADPDADLRSLAALMRRVTKLEDPAATPGLGGLVTDLASGEYRSAAEALADLRELRPAPAEPRAVKRPRGWLAFAVVVLLALAAIGALRLGERSPSGRLVPGGHIDGTRLEILGQRDFDPESTGGAPGENSRSVHNAVDGDANTYWSTENYGESPDFSGLKSGVGLIFDVGSDAEVRGAEILFLAGGCSFQLRFSGDKNAPVGEWPVVQEVKNSDVSAAIEFAPTKARYWMVWITGLTRSGSGYRCSIKEVDLFSP